MPNVPELQAEAVKWQRRLGMIQQAGLNTGPATQLAKTDLQRLIQGGTPLQEDQIVSMVHSAYTGGVSTPAKPAGTDWNPLHLIGNVGKDVATDVRSFMPGLIHEGADILNPNKWAQVPGDLAKAGADLGQGNIGDAAKEIVATPIIGSLVPGAFAASGGWSQATQHPLNTILSVLPIVSAGSKLVTLGADEAAAGTALAALKQGHPIQAVARATGLESKLVSAMQAHGGQFNYMPVWRAYNELARVYARRLATEAISELKGSGLIGHALSAEDSQRLVVDAQAYNPRFETPPVEVQAGDIANSNGDAAAAFANVPAGRDVTAFIAAADPNFAPHMRTGVVTASPLIDQTPIFFSPQEAIKSLGPDMAPYAKDFVHEVRVSPADIHGVEGGGWTGKNVAPSRTYVDGEGQQLQAIRAFSEKYQAKSVMPRKDPTGKIIDSSGTRKNKDSMNVVLPNPVTGKPEIYARKSVVARSYEKAQSASKRVNVAASRLESTRGALEHAKNVAGGRTETYAKYGESAADAAKRPPSLPSVKSLHDAGQEFILEGMYGPNKALYEKLDAGFMAGSPQAIKTALRNLQTKLRSEGAGSANALAYAKYLYDRSNQLGTRQRLAAAGAAKALNAKAAFDDAMKELSGAKKAHAAAEKSYIDEIRTNPPDRFHPLIHEQARGHMISNATDTFFEDVAKAKTQMQGAGLGEAIAQLHAEYQRLVTKITDAHSHEDLQAFVPEDTLKAVEKNAFMDWVGMAKAGYDPIWTHELSAQHYNNMTWGEIRPLPTRIMIPASAKAKIFDFSPQVLDIGAVLTAHAVDYLQTEATTQFVDFLVNKSGTVHKLAEVEADLKKRFPDDWMAVETHLKNDFTPFAPHDYVPSWKGPKEDKYVIPKTVDKGFKQLLEGDKLPLHSIREPAHRMFKVSVLTGPRHMVHVAAGGMVMTVLQEPGAVLEMLAHPVAIFKLAKEGTIAPEIARLGIPNHIHDALSKGMYEERVDQIHGLRSGTKLGEWFRQSAGGEGLHALEQKVNNVENMVTDFYRSATYLHEMKNGANNEAALAMVNKTLIDVDNLTPFERTVVRQVFPFWTFTKHILRYVMTYPSDHPLRASILSSLANHIETTNSSGDPARLSKLFMLGEPDPTGKITTVDMSNLNPFRSMSSVFSMSGFLMGLMPEFQVGLKAMGINPLTGTLSMHQNFSYDAYTGTNVASRPKLNPFDFASAFIPQVEILDHFLLLTDTMKRLKQTNPEAYSRTLFQEMNLPFAVAPINIYDVRAKAAAAQFRDAQTSVSNAFVTGNTAGIRTFQTVPFQGHLYPADQVANYIDHFDQLFPGIAPKAVYKKPKRTKTRLLGG